jgi:lycopene beta-cyclase
MHIPIGTAGNLTRLSTGYTFQAIQSFSKSLAISLKQCKKIVIPAARAKKYNFLDEILLQVIKNDPDRMPSIFFNLFKNNTSKTIINFLTDRSNLVEDIKIISTMPIILFAKTLFRYVLGLKK